LAIKSRELKTSAGPIRLTYFHNLRWDGRTLAEVENIRRDFTTFAAYRGFLEESKESFAANAGSQDRQYPRRLLATLSSGYDSPTAAAIASKFGLDEAVVFDSPRKEARDFHRGFQEGAPTRDSGREVAAALGLRPLGVAHDAWMDRQLPEVPLLAADGYGEEVFLRDAEHHLPGTVLFTGFHGGTMWDKRTRDDDGNLYGPPAGLGLTEYRLSAGFLACPDGLLGRPTNQRHCPVEQLT
jgi:hypothetical protein